MCFSYTNTLNLADDTELRTLPSNVIKSAGHKGAGHRLADDGRLARPDLQKLLASAALHTSPYFRDFGNIASPLSMPLEINRCVLSAI